MRILALGGAGAMARAAIRKAVTLPAVREIVIADRDVVAAHAVADELVGQGVRIDPRRVDVTALGELHDALRGVDVVLNTVGPYHRFGTTVLEAAIRTRTNYLDICDDWEPTAQMLALDTLAREAGVCAIIGMGASPGVSNLLAALAARELDTVENAYTAWPVDISEPLDSAETVTVAARTSAAMAHWMHQISGTIAVARAGEITREAPLRAVTLTLPGGRSGTTYTVGHPEPLTLHRTLAPSGEAANLMVVTPGTVAYLDVLRTDIDNGKLTDESAAGDLAKPTLRRALRSAKRMPAFRSHGNLPPFFATVTGTAGPEHRTVLAHLLDTAETVGFTADMAEFTGIPLALGLSQLADGRAARPGVHAPEAIIDPYRFFTDLGVHLGVDPTRLVSVEHAPSAAPADAKASSWMR